MELHFTAKFNSKLTCFTTKICFPEERKEKKECWTFYTRQKQRKKEKSWILEIKDMETRKKKKEQKKREREKKRKKKKKSSTKHAGKKLKVRAN